MRSINEQEKYIEYNIKKLIEDVYKGENETSFLIEVIKKVNKRANEIIEYINNKKRIDREIKKILGYIVKLQDLLYLFDEKRLIHITENELIQRVKNDINKDYETKEPSIINRRLMALSREFQDQDTLVNMLKKIQNNITEKNIYKREYPPFRTREKILFYIKKILAWLDVNLSLMDIDIENICINIKEFDKSYYELDNILNTSKSLSLTNRNRIEPHMIILFNSINISKYLTVLKNNLYDSKDKLLGKGLPTIEDVYDTFRIHLLLILIDNKHKSENIFFKEEFKLITILTEKSNYQELIKEPDYIEYKELMEKIHFFILENFKKNNFYSFKIKRFKVKYHYIEINNTRLGLTQYNNRSIDGYGEISSYYFLHFKYKKFII